jgi:hypothetical protein
VSVTDLEEQNRTILYVSEVLEDCGNANWKAFSLPSEYLEKKYLLLEVYDNPGFQEEPTELIGCSKVKCAWPL